MGICNHFQSKKKLFLTSASCESDISTKVLAAGCTTSNNFIIVAPSFDIVVLPERRGITFQQ